MCIHPKDNTSSIDVNKLLEDLNNSHTDMDEFHEFAGSCNYHSGIDDLDSKTADLRIMHLNIRSVLNKQNDLLKLLQTGKIDICLLNETWLNKSNIRFLNLEDYKFESSERKSLKKGGGVDICLSKDLSYVRQSDLELKLPGLELCIVEILDLNKNVLALSLYRLPDQEAKTFSELCGSLLKLLCTEKNKHIIVGTNYNFDLLKCSMHNQMQDFFNLFLDNDMWPTITKPTHITKSCATLIDNIFVSPHIYSKHNSGIVVDDISDHFLCVLLANDLKLKKKESTVITSRKITPKNN